MPAETKTTTLGEPEKSATSFFARLTREKPYRITLKLMAAFVLILILMLLSRSEVDFVYRGF
jgi:hypothetical protein